MFRRSRVFRAFCSIALLISVASVFHAQTGSPTLAPTLVVEGLGRGTFALGGPWQFHTGDDPNWANPAFDDSSWEQVDVSRSWGDQGHWAYMGHAWYRRHIEIKDENDGAVEVALNVPIATCAY